MKSLLTIIVLSLTFHLTAIAQKLITQVKPADQKEWGYMNIEGEMLINAKYRKCFKFSEEGLAPIYEDKKFTFINTSGEELPVEVKGFKLIEGGFGIGLKGFSDGMAAVRVGKKWGYINTQGKKVIDTKYDKVSIYDGGYATVKKGETFYIINKNGEETKVEDSKAYAVKHFSEGLAPYNTKDKMNGFVGTDGKVVIPTQFAAVGYFTDGLAWAKTKDKKVGYINNKGEWVIEPKFLAAKDFDPVSGLARVKNEGGWTYVNKNGETISVATDSYGNFSEGLARGKKNGKTGYFDAKGEWVIPAKFNGGRDFKNGYAAVKDGEKWGFINLEGKWVIEPTFDAVKDMEMVK